MNVWDFIHAKYSASVEVILLCVLESIGSSPGRQGFKMAVAEDGSFFGTIGGGIMEHKFVEMAKVRLGEPLPAAADIYKQIHDKSAVKNQSGMICSGEQTIFFYKVQLTDLEHIFNLSTSLQHHQNGALTLTMSGIRFSEVVPESNYEYILKGNDFYFTEKTGFKNILHIIGGGHCALSFSRLMSGLDFYIHLYDTREGLSTMNNNSFPHEKILVNTYEQLTNMINGGNNVYVVIMTFGYRTDDEALRALLGKDFCYIGMLGSKRKIEKMFAQYKEEKLDELLLQKVHSPIGIQIRSQTPEEIAISIAAEIISVKNLHQ